LISGLPGQQACRQHAFFWGGRCSLVVAAYAEAAEVLKADQLRLAIA
jgi:hypothetical protein